MQGPARDLDAAQRAVLVVLLTQATQQDDSPIDGATRRTIYAFLTLEGDLLSPADDVAVPIIEEPGGWLGEEPGGWLGEEPQGSGLTENFAALLGARGEIRVAFKLFLRRADRLLKHDRDIDTWPEAPHDIVELAQDPAMRQFVRAALPHLPFDPGPGGPAAGL